MKALKYILKSVLLSILLSIVLRIIFGLYSVFGTPVILLALALGLCSALCLSGSGNGTYLAGAMLHILLVTSLYILFDVTDTFRLLASDSADFFAKLAGRADGRVNLLWCILFIMPIYFFSFVVSSGIISSVKGKRKLLIEKREHCANEDAEQNDTLPRHLKTFKK